jgi:hypothetical protein
MVTLAQKRYMVLGSLSKSVDIIYGGISSNSNARWFFLDVFVDCGTDTWLEAEWDPPKQFLRDLAAGLLARRPLSTEHSVYTCDLTRYMEKKG